MYLRQEKRGYNRTTPAGIKTKREKAIFES
jgi:hypothetical protein